MFKPARNALFAMVAAIAFSVVTAEAASRNSADLLRYIPADTPYVFASTQPLPDRLADKFEPTVNQILHAYQRVIRDGITFENARSLDLLIRSYDAPVLVHCGSSNRVGALLALRASLAGADDEAAIAVGKRGGLTRLETQVRKVLSEE